MFCYPPDLSLYFRPCVRELKGCSRAQEVSRTVMFHPPLLRQLTALLSIVLFLVGNCSSQPPCSELVRRILSGFVHRCKTCVQPCLTLFWPILSFLHKDNSTVKKQVVSFGLVVGLQQNIKIHFRKARQLKCTALVHTCSSLLHQGLYPVCCEWIGKSNWYSNLTPSLWLSSHLLPSAEHLACGVQSIKL